MSDMRCDCGDSECASCGTAQGTRRIPPGHVGITDPRPIPLHGPLTCDLHGPTVTVTWRAGDRCPLCGSYAVERAARRLIAALDDIVPGWREATLDQGAAGDETSAAWDRLVRTLGGEEG